MSINLSKSLENSDSDSEHCSTIRGLARKLHGFERYTDTKFEKLENKILNMQVELMTLLKDMIGVIDEEAKKNKKSEDCADNYMKREDTNVNKEEEEDEDDK